jgi:hypothetical protein
MIKVILLRVFFMLIVGFTLAISDFLFSKAVYFRRFQGDCYDFLRGFCWAWKYGKAHGKKSIGKG